MSDESDKDDNAKEGVASFIDKKAGFKTALFKMDDGGSVSGEKGKLQVACFITGSEAALTASVRKN